MMLGSDFLIDAVKVADPVGSYIHFFFTDLKTSSVYEHQHWDRNVESSDRSEAVTLFRC